MEKENNIKPPLKSTIYILAGCCSLSSTCADKQVSQKESTQVFVDANTSYTEVPSCFSSLQEAIAPRMLKLAQFLEKGVPLFLSLKECIISFDFVIMIHFLRLYNFGQISFFLHGNAPKTLDDNICIRDSTYAHRSIR